MIYYINVNKKRIVGRNNQISTRPLNLEYNTIEHLEFQFITDNNQIVELENLSGLALAVGLKQNKPSYDLLALSRDYTIEDNVLKFNLNCYTVNWLREINKNNTEAYIEISQESLEAKQVMLRDYCYVWPRTLIDGLTPEEIQSNNYYTKIETDQAIEAAISGIVPPSGDYATEEYVDNAISGLASQEYVNTALEGKQNLINADNKLAYDMLSGTPTIPTKTSDLNNDSGFVTSTDVETAISGKADKSEIPTNTSDLNNDSDFQDAVQVQTAIDAAVSGKQDLITVDNKLDYALISGAPETPTVEWGAISGTLSAQTDLQDALNAKADAEDIPLSTSQLTNDSGFITNADLNGYATETYVDNAVSGLATEADLTTHTSDTNIHVTASEKEDWNGKLGPGDLPADIATETWVNEQLSAKQDAITNDNKLDYALISGAPTIPLSTSQLTNDSDFVDQAYVTNAISGKAEQNDVDAISGELEEMDEMLENYNMLYVPFYLEATEAGDEVGFVKVGSAPTISLKYSTDNETWNDYTVGNMITLQNVGDRVYFKGNNVRIANTNISNYNEITCTSGTNAGGNIMSLLDETMMSRTVERAAFGNLLAGNINLKNASKLQIPATTLAQDCYRGMLSGCTSLTVGPNALPAPTLVRGCYNSMFRECSSLIKAPNMLAKTLQIVSNSDLHCSNMFRGCSSLTKAPEINIKTIGGQCFAAMFRDCTNLAEIKVHFTAWNDTENATASWLNGTAASGTFYCPSGLDTTTRNVNRVPENWTVVNI